MKIILLLLFILNTSVSFASKEICSTVVLHFDEEKFKLSKTEKLLVCGDPDNASYRNIPPYQASYFFTAFLQARGYLKPRFETIENVLHVHTGKIQHLKKIHVDSEVKKERRAVKKDLKRRFHGEILNPNLLDSMTKRTTKIIGERGYPCSDPELTTNIDLQKVFIKLNEGNYYQFGEVDREKIKGLRDNALERYYPYKAKDSYNEKLLKLNEKRLLRSEVLQGTYYLDNCGPNMKDFALSQHFMVGPPRTFRFGVGASTEVGPMIRARWSNNRYKSMASILALSAQASFRSQTLNASADSFFWKNLPRQSLFSQLEITRESQIDYEQSVLSLKPHMKWTYDSARYLQTYTLGPSYELSSYRAASDPVTNKYQAVNINGSTVLMSHTYEFFDYHPQEGSIFGFNFDFRHPELGFTDPLLMLNATYGELVELGTLGKGLLIGGMRFNAGTTWVADDVLLEDLPPSVKFYGGGSNDVRGFLLNTLPDNNGTGALTKLELKLELRKTNVFIESIEFFAFVDNAVFGQKSWGTDPRLWYSPGTGLRWLSPLGIIQGYVARGFATNPGEDFGNFYYAGMGGTF